jgi:ABC-type molybdenum transport system ATPase subunit/photorepair protein PhrA
MKRSIAKCLQRETLRRQYGTKTARPPIIHIANGTFYRHHPNSHHAATQENPALFPNLNFELPSFCDKPEYWSIIGPSNSGKTTFLQILRGQHLSIPSAARSYPYLESEEIEKKDHELRIPSRAIKHVGFDGEQGLGGQAPQTAYLSARYESRREDTDFSVLDYLRGNTELNPLQDIGGKKIDPGSLERVIKDLRLGDLLNMPVSNLSNGQTRRARIGKALLSDPEALLLDEPFMGLDPPTLLTLSPMLYDLAERNAPRLLLGLRPQDPIPDWITHLIYLEDNCKIAFHGLKDEVLYNVRSSAKDTKSLSEIGRILTTSGIVQPEPVQEQVKDSPIQQHTDPFPTSRDGYALEDQEAPRIGEPLVEMEGARVTYGTKAVLGNWIQEVDGSSKDGLWWTIRRGQRWGIFGPNGSGKTTILSLICSDHPQTYSLPIRLFGRSRIPETGQLGISIFDIQARIGHSSPEIHNHIPKSLTLRKVLANAWADTFLGVPKLDPSANGKIDACLRWFEQDLRPSAKKVAASDASAKPTWADEVLFGGLPFSAQRVALFLRAIIKQPDLVILDESFSGMDDGVRDRCLLFLAHGETKRYSDTSSGKSARYIEDSEMEDVKLTGLTEDQALLCISHVREEIPGSIREWICLPEANTGLPARFGRLNGPIEGDYRRWNEIWGM